MNNFTIQIVSLPDRENCVCEVSYLDVQWAEISQEADEIMIQFYPHPNRKYWEFSLDVALEVLQKAKNCFLDIP